MEGRGAVGAAGGLLVVEIRGGTFKAAGYEKMGVFNADLLIPIHAACGIGNGMIDLVRAIIPSDMVGGHVQKLQRLDSLVSTRRPSSLYYVTNMLDSLLLQSLRHNRITKHWTLLHTPPRP